MRIIFLGTPEFAVSSLEAIFSAKKHKVVCVVTSVDKPAGRGHKIQESAVKIKAKELNIPILQPTNLKDPDFLAQLKSYNADLQVVVAFRMLPEVVWNMPKYGTINLHAALLPQYRGAAPINWAIINGEKVTGVSTFLLKQEIDTGDVILREKVDILPQDNAGTIHDKLMNMGGNILLKSIDLISSGEVKFLKQSELEKGVELHPAPKIFKQDMQINWENDAQKIHNFVRGLSPYPCAWCFFDSFNPFLPLINKDDNKVRVKVFETKISNKKAIPGHVFVENKHLYVGTATDAIEIVEMQIEGRNRKKASQML